jgi:hypothetical protein
MDGWLRLEQAKGCPITRSGPLISHWTDEGGSPAKGGAIAAVHHGHGGSSPERGEIGIPVDLIQHALLLHGSARQGTHQGGLRAVPRSGRWCSMVGWRLHALARGPASPKGRSAS